MTEESKPRALSLSNFSFNFSLSLQDRVRARAGAPAFATRRLRLDRALASFWSALNRRYQALWIAAGEGRLDENGRELRQALLDDEGRDPIALREHKRVLFRDRVEPADFQRDAFNRAWPSHVDRCGLDQIEAKVDAYNKYFPIEANLMVDPTDGHYVWMGKPWEPMTAPTRADVFARFPLQKT